MEFDLEGDLPGASVQQSGQCIDIGHFLQGHLLLDQVGDVRRDRHIVTVRVVMTDEPGDAEVDVQSFAGGEFERHHPVKRVALGEHPSDLRLGQALGGSRPQLER